MDLIDKVGHGGDFISQKHTARNYRKEVYYPSFFNRRQRAAYEAVDGKTLNQKLNERVREIIEADTPKLIDEHTEKVFDEIIRDRARELKLLYSV